MNITLKSILTTFIILGFSSSAFTQRLSAELSTLPVVGMFPKDGNVRYSNAEIRGELFGVTLNYRLIPFDPAPNNHDDFELAFSLSAHLLGINWGQLLSPDENQTTLLDWGYLRAGFSVPFEISDNINLRFQTGLGRVIIRIPELTRTGYQWGLDLSFSLTYDLNI